MATLPPYREAMQDSTDALNDGPSPPMSNSPALSSSPMPCLQPPDATFTPVSMDSENLAAPNTDGDFGDNRACCNTSQENLVVGGSPSTATTRSGSINALIQSIKPAAQATTVNKHASSEYDLLLPGDPSSLSSSPQLDSATSPASVASVEKKDHRDLPSPDPKVTLTTGKSTGRESHVNASNSESTATHASKPPTTGSPLVERDPSLPVRSSLSIKDFPLSESKNEQSLHHHHHHNHHHSHQQQQPTQHFPAILKPKPLIRTASTKRTSLVHPSPSSRSRANSYASNIAQLEATAEKLSMTSSIEDAIRDLHGELKRSDSRRSSILAASVASSSAAPPIPDATSTASISRQVSAAASILETNNAARHGGYSPAAYVMSPNNSLLSNSTTRLRSGSVTRMDASDAEPAPLTRNGPGKTSMRSVRSTSKPPALTGIAELEPTTLTAAAMDAADKLEEYPEEEANLAVPPLEDVDRTPNANDYGSTSVNDYWDQAYAEAQKQPLSKHQGQPPRSTSPSNSVGTFEQAELAFADFDGSHCPPEQQEEDDFLPPLHGIDMSLEVPEDTPGRPRISRPTAPTVRPKSYMDPETGQQMMYYPARVPLMLNLPQKLSKKPKASERNKRRSQVLNAMPEATRQSANWLPEVLPEPLFDPLGSGSNSNLASPSVHPDSNPLSPQLADSNMDLTLGLPSESEAQPRPRPQGNNEDARKSRLSMMGMSVMDPSDKRNTRVSAFEALPPQLRASAFFDLPSQSPALELKGGSASATLDDILNASAKAPVSAFTDHAFAGHLGHEVYGNEKKRKSHMKRASNATLLEVKDGKESKDVKKRSSFFHLRTPSKLSISQTSTKETKKNAAVDDDLDHESDDERTKLSGSINGEREPGAEEDDDEDEEEEIDEDMPYNGPPTTLLAELQMRKHQQKLRTRPIAQAYPNGMHSTLLELDTVAETERKNRKGKKINLAWETPDDGADDDDDEDLPLGLVMAKKNGIHDAQAVIAEMNRPLGLMERREQEENEPLSRRQARLQGRNPGPMTQRKTMTSLGGALGMGGGYGPSPSGSRLDLSTPPDDEVEGESLGDRMRRLRAKEEGDGVLPRARPVSMAFSTELFSQLGDTFKEDENSGSQDKDKQKATGPAEEEETLGQRRRRLQAEREAREREMGAGAPLNPNMPPPGIMPKLDKRHSLADVLGNNNSSRRVLSDPRMEAERARQEEAARFRRDQESKLAALRSQMPQNLSGPQMPRSGAYAAGQFNDGTGGTGLQRHSHVPSFAAPHQAPGMGMGMNGGMMGNNYNMAAGYGAPGGYGAPAAGYSMQQMNMMPMTMQQPGQQHDMVDRWRQSIVP